MQNLRKDLEAMNSKEVAKLRLIDADMDLLNNEWLRVQKATRNGDGFGFLEAKKQIDFVIGRIARNIRIALEAESESQ